MNEISLQTKLLRLPFYALADPIRMSVYIGPILDPSLAVNLEVTSDVELLDAGAAPKEGEVHQTLGF